VGWFWKYWRVGRRFTLERSGLQQHSALQFGFQWQPRLLEWKSVLRAARTLECAVVEQSACVLQRTVLQQPCRQPLVRGALAFQLRAQPQLFSTGSIVFRTEPQLFSAGSIVLRT
jgi:hypothetical protein